jgi:hypothetical protein
MKMNKKLSKGLIVSVIAMLLVSTFAVFQVQALPGPVIYLEDPYGPGGQYKWDTSTVPAQFNVTIWVTNTVAWKLMMWQLCITFNDDYLNITDFVGSVSGRNDSVMAWPNDDLEARAWDPRYVFYDGVGFIGNPTYYHLSAGAGAVTWGDCLFGDESLTAGIAYKLGAIQFNVTRMPNKGEILNCTLGINNADIYMYDYVGPIPDVTKQDGYYELTWKEPIPPLQVSISPLSASILIGQSVTFTSTVSGGYTPYTYQWYLNGAPVSGATSSTWTFTPTTSGIYYIHLKVTDAKGNAAQSDTARITVAAVPVGGYSFPIQVPTKAEPVLPYIALMATLTAIFTKLRPKTKRKR